MMQLTDKTMAMPLPEGAERVYYDGAASIGFYLNGDLRFIHFPPGTYRFLFTTTTATEEDARKVVETIHIEEGPSPGNDFAGGWDTGYVDYENRGEFAGYQGDAGVFRKAIESLHSLLRSKGLDDKNNFAIIEKLK